MVKSIAHCHENNIIHRDVKLENFLVKKNSVGNLIVKLSDFGIACSYDINSKSKEKSGSLLNVAPEILQKDDFCPKIDCWGLGVILYELLTTMHPFNGRSMKDVMNNITK